LVWIGGVVRREKVIISKDNLTEEERKNNTKLLIQMGKQNDYRSVLNMNLFPKIT
jgi:hypothetical protein